MSETRTYRVDVHHEPDHMWAQVVELPGVFATGADEDELREALAEAIGMYLSERPGECLVLELDFDDEPESETTRVQARAILQPA